MTKNNIELIRAWTTQLKQEYEYICWSRGVGLKPPLIEIVDVSSFWGKWTPQSRSIKIASRLILEYSWDVVIGVLKHEMAHQMVADIWKSPEKHGRLFRASCERLGAPEEFMKAGGELPQGFKLTQDDCEFDQNRTILEKVRKLLSLAESSNEHEAALAMQKANELIARHNIDRLENQQKSKYIHRLILTGKKRIENYQSHICSILIGFFYVEVIIANQYNALDDQHYRVIDILGAEENVLIAEYVYSFLMNQLELLWREHSRKTGRPGRQKRSYFLGVLRGFREKLEAQDKARNISPHNGTPVKQSSSALVLAADKGLAKFKQRIYPRLRTRTSSSSSVDRSAFLAGVEDGRELNLHKGVAEQDGNKGRLIGRN